MSILRAAAVALVAGLVGAAAGTAHAGPDAGPDDRPDDRPDDGSDARPVGTSGRWLCIPHHAGPYNECWKGNSFDEASVERCLVAQRKKPKRQPRLRVGDGAWIEVPRRGRRCVALPAGRHRIVVENFGRTYASWRQDGRAPCRSGTLLLVGPNFYGAMYAQCTKRAATPAEQAAATSP